MRKNRSIGIDKKFFTLYNSVIDIVFKFVIDNLCEVNPNDR